MGIVGGRRGLELCGRKIRLRPFTHDDIDQTYLSWLNDPVVVQYSNQRFRQHTRESCSRYLTRFEGTENLFLSVRQLLNDKPIGTMTAYLSQYHGTVDVGIMIGEKACWGMGYGQDAWDTLTNFLLKKQAVRKLTAGASAINRGMIILMERSGMRLECRRIEQELIDGQPTDVLHYAKFPPRK